jgi:hypothetical protein
LKIRIGIHPSNHTAKHACQQPFKLALAPELTAESFFEEIQYVGWEAVENACSEFSSIMILL